MAIKNDNILDKTQLNGKKRLKRDYSSTDSEFEVSNKRHKGRKR